MRIAKRSAWGFAALAALIAGGVVALVIVVGGVGESAVEAWIGEQIRLVANDHLKPDLGFESLDYQAPRTVVLTGVRLVADDPDRPGERVEVIRADRIRIELAELPKKGEPLRLKVIEIEGPTVRLVDQADGGLVGFSDFVEEQPSGDSPPVGEVLRITRILIKDGAVEYDARQPDAEPMRFDRIDTALAIDQSDPGVYGLDIRLEREDVTAIRLIGDWDVDAMAIRVESLKADIEMARQYDRHLPPQVQAFIKAYDLVGDLSLQARGRLDLKSVVNSDADVSLQLSQAHGSVGGYRFPIDRLDLDATMQGRQVKVNRLAGELFGGEVSGDGAVRIDGALDAMLNLSGNGLRLEELLDGEGADEPARFAGTTDLRVKAAAPLTDVLGRMTGDGELRLSDGRLARLPLISSLIDFMASRGELRRKDDEPAGRDRARIVFELRGDHAYFSESEIVGTWFAMRSRGKVFFDGRLALNVNAGPLEKVQESLGAIGSVFSAVTDGLMAYRVGGAVENLTIRPIPLGGIIGAPGENE